MSLRIDPTAEETLTSLSVSCRYRKTSAELYEARARGQVSSLRSSQISTHPGLDGQRRSSVLSSRTQDQVGQSSAVTPAAMSSQEPSVRVQDQQDRRSLLDQQTAEQLHV